MLNKQPDNAHFYLNPFDSQLIQVMVSRTRRILVVDDVTDNLTLLKFFLESEGYAVETADSGKEALSKLQTLLPDLILLDFRMPDMNGAEVVQRLRQNNKLSRIPVLLLTACCEADLSPLLPAIGIHVCLHKPIDLDELLMHIRRVCHSVMAEVSLSR